MRISDWSSDVCSSDLSTGAVLLGEIGDKTMLLALVLATRFRKPMPVIAGIVVATVFNHALAGLVGGWLRAVISAEYLPWIVGISFIAVGLWALVPDKIDEDEAKPKGNRSEEHTSELQSLMRHSYAVFS